MDLAFKRSLQIFSLRETEGLARPVQKLNASVR